jgi:hypothetical protein
MLCGGLQFLEGNMTLKPIVHEIRIQNQVIFLDPPIEYARATWIKQLHDWLGACSSTFINVVHYLFFCRCGVPATPHTKLALRNWVADARSFCSRDDLYLSRKLHSHPRLWTLLICCIS